MTFHYILLISRLGKCRLAKWYAPTTLPDRQRIIRDMTALVLNRRLPPPTTGTNKLHNSTNIAEYRDTRVVYKKYASLWFVGAIGMQDNALLALEALHRLVETLDKYFGNVCELDLIFNFNRAFYVLDEFIQAGEVMEPEWKCALKAVCDGDDQEREMLGSAVGQGGERDSDDYY